MIATQDSFEPHSSAQLPGSRRVYLRGRVYPDIRVPMREIAVSPTRTLAGQEELNDPVRVYDCSGPWGDPEYDTNVEEGLPSLRRDWILARGDTEEYEGRV